MISNELLRITFYEWSGIQYTVSCEYFIPINDKTVYCCNGITPTTDISEEEFKENMNISTQLPIFHTDKIHCGRYPRKSRPYRIRSAYVCWKCAYRHGKAKRLT